MNRSLKLFLPLLALLSIYGVVLAPNVSAVSGGEFKAERIIDDSVFFRYGDLAPEQIQSFLNSKVPVCDTNHARTNSANDSGPPYICLKDYRQDTPSKPAEAGLCGPMAAKANASSAQIIYDVSQACGVSTRVLLVLLQKEQSLITDTWPWNIQYRSATGYGCPDTAPCDNEYYGFFNQVYHAARVYKVYAKINGPNYRVGYTNYIQWHPNAGCGGSDVFIQSQATAGLYNYTPYRPNQAALNNLYGTGDSCSSYGNRNFWRMYNDWFGSTQTNLPYAWSLLSQEAYSDNARSRTYSSAITAKPGDKVYMRVTARNVGLLTWSNSSLRLGTSNPRDRSSPFQSNTWITPTRTTTLQESSVNPGETGTFVFEMTAPPQTGTYQEYFNLVADGASWLQDIGFYYTINVVSPTQPDTSIIPSLQSGSQIRTGDHIMSQDTQSILALQGDGNLVLYTDFSTPVWKSDTSGAVDRLAMQTDGNLVLYNASNAPIWQTGTYGNPGAYLTIQTDGNLVLYNQFNSPLWAVNKLHNPDLLAYVNTSLYGLSMQPRQSLETANRKYRFIQQLDGNAVLYNVALNKALWHTGTAGRNNAKLSLQPDGNLVLYSPSGQPLWNTNTHIRGLSRLTIQPDGNLVLYDAANRPTWATGTAGQ